MFKFLLFLLLAWVVWRWWQARNLASSKAEAPPAPRAPEAMVRCAVCGVHLPASEAVLASSAAVQAGRTYCSQAHRLADEQGGR